MYRYFNINDILRLVIGISLSSLIFFIYAGNFEKIFVINQLLFFFLLSSFLISYRILIKLLFSKINETSDNISNVMVFSAGNSGIITKRAFYNSSEFKILGFIDDDKFKIGKTLDGVTVFEIGVKLNKFIDDNNISRVIISTKKISKNRQAYLFKYFQDLNIQILKLPPVKSWINGIPNIYNLKEIKIEDLLNRGLIKIDNKKNNLLYFGKSILVTGAAGSIGSEIVKQVIKFKPARIILLDNSETPMFNIKEELVLISHNIELLYYIDSVTDKKAVNKIFSSYKIDVVFHAAAYKHVNMMEANPRTSIINNIYGTKLIIDFSIEYNVHKFVLISSDKAVNPTNVMGASKRICELYLASKISDSENKTKFITTRFGNVLGSNGSVVPIFEKQIRNGGPITITHPDIVRYFMTIPEAAQLVIEAGALGRGGEVFVFDMGNPVKIVDLAKNMIIQKGLKVGLDINIEYTGLRPGEKLFEELLIESEELLKTHNELIFITKKDVVGKDLSKLIDNLIDLAFNSFDHFKVVSLMKKIVPEYVSNNSKFQSLDNNDKNIL
ncbi:polysaccharide biosynthesis protein [Flavobacteriaceae bacterium]|nr:polysaccharide biosynthesis protein [Flavobacteriaceae bacterium]MDC0506616.1 polysaccharide biosynthesis protein [Flavobacteriaceae bacterium]